MVNMSDLANDIINGKRLDRNDDLDFFVTAPLDEVCSNADRIRSALCGDNIDLCSIINGKSGKCSENCKFCAQSAHHCTGIAEYDFLPEEKIVNECLSNKKKGVHRFSIVTAGKTLSDTDFEKALSAYRRINEVCDIKLCASHGSLSEEQFILLKNSGVSMYHCNIETSERFFPEICTTHTFSDKIQCIRRAQKCGLDVCSGGIIGMGETWHDRIDMALCLSDLKVRSIPINALTPIEGTPLAGRERLSEEDILRTTAIFRYINPTAYIRLAAGRNLMKNSGKEAFVSGANATITGDMLTTSGNNIRSDIEMLSDLGFNVTAD